MELNFTKKSGLVAMVVALGLVACNSNNGGQTTTTTTSGGTTTPAYNPCTDINGCVVTGTGFQFPDGAGGTVSCASGACTDSNPNNNATSLTAYNNGFNAGYNQGANDYSGSGYNQGYNDGYNSGYNDGYNGGYNDGYNDGYNSGYYDGWYGYSVAGGTKDTDLQKARLETALLNYKAKNISQQFGMSLDAATQITQLADKVQKMSVQGQMTTDDRSAIAQSALGIAGVNVDDVNSAIMSSLKGDNSATDSLMEKAAQNLGMSDPASLRDKLLPALGLSM